MQGRSGPYPLVLEEIRKEDKSVYNLTNCCELKIEMKIFRRRRRSRKVRRGSFNTCMCSTTKSKCVNCGGDYLSIALRYPVNSKNASDKKEENEPEQRRQ